MIKRFFALTVKFFISLLPLNLKNSLKKNPTLLTVYSKLLQKSGLFYGFPSKARWMKDYKHRLKDMEHEINELIASSSQVKEFAEQQNSVFICITETNVGCLEDTLNSVSLCKRKLDVFLWCEPNLVAKLSPKHKALTIDSRLESFKAIVGMNPILVINAGDAIHPLIFDLYLRFANSASDVVYFDTDTMEKSSRVEPHFFPDWNPDLQLTTGYVKTAAIFRNFATLTSYGHDRLEEFFIMKWFMLTAANPVKFEIQHIPYVTTHIKKTLYSRGLSNIATGWLEKITNANSVALIEQSSIFSFNWLPKEQPLVSIIIPTKNGKALVKSCIESILKKSTYQNFEILLVDNNSDDVEALNYFDELAKNEKIRLLKYSFPFNYSAINNFAVKQAHGQIIGLVNNDIEVITPNWLEYLVGHALREEIGCVGAKLLYSDTRIQHAGVVLGYGGGAGHAHKYFPRFHRGYLNRLQATQNYSAVTAACLFVKRSDFYAVDGLNERDLTIAFNDVDFCLKVRALGKRNVYCADAELFHHESVSRGVEDTPEKQLRFANELRYLQNTWADVIANDPAYNANLTLNRENFSIKK